MALARPRTAAVNSQSMKILLCMLVRNERECLEIMLPKLPRAGTGHPASTPWWRSTAIPPTAAPNCWRNRGSKSCGRAARAAARACLEVMEKYPADAYLFFSPDGNEDIADIAKFRPLLEAGADLVIASRMCAGAVNEEDGHWFRPRKAANMAFNFLANSAFRKKGPYVTDSINGFRAIRAGSGARSATGCRRLHHRIPDDDARPARRRPHCRISHPRTSAPGGRNRGAQHPDRICASSAALSGNVALDRGRKSAGSS